MFVQLMQTQEFVLLLKVILVVRDGVGGYGSSRGPVMSTIKQMGNVSPRFKKKEARFWS